MRLTALDYGDISFAQTFPPGDRDARIPQSQPFTADMPFGQLYIQQVETDPYCFWKHRYRVREDTTIRVIDDQYWCGFRWMLKSHLYHRLDGNVDIYLKQGQFNFLYTPKIESSFRLKEGMEYEIFDMQVSWDLLKGLGVEAKVLDRFLELVANRKLEILGDHPAWASAELLDVLAEVMLYPRDSAVVKHLLRLIVQAAEQNRDIIALTEQQVEAIFQARDLILHDLSQWKGIEALSKAIHVNEYTFKNGFKQVFGVSPYQYAKYERLNMAQQLLRETSLPLADIAAMVGFDSVQTFGTAFKKRFEITALQFRKNRNSLTKGKRQSPADDWR